MGFFRVSLSEGGPYVRVDPDDPAKVSVDEPAMLGQPAG